MSGTSGVAKLLTAWLQKGAPNQKPKWPTKVCLDGGHIPALTAYEYRAISSLHGHDRNFPTAPRQSVLFIRVNSLDRLPRFKESRASCSKVKSKPRNREWSCARNGLMSSSELEVTRSSRAMLVATLPCAPTFTGLISFDSDTIGSCLVNALR